MTRKCMVVDLHQCHHHAVSLPLPWKMRLLIFVHSIVTDASRCSNGTINRCLLSFLDSSSLASPKPVAGVCTADTIVNPSHNLWFCLFVPASRIPLIVFFHGGSFAFLSLDSCIYDAVCRRICRKVNAVIASLNYRLLPEYWWPTQYDDGEDVLGSWMAGGWRDPTPS